MTESKQSIPPALLLPVAPPAGYLSLDVTNSHEITDNADWTTRRLALMAKEKEFTRLRDELSALRRALPWRRLETPYAFVGADGRRTLAELFEGKRQLLVYHFMLGAQTDAGCPSCSFWADHFDAMRPHLGARDTAFAVLSAGPIDKLTSYAKRMDWQFPWLSTAGTDFNEEFAVSFSKEAVESKDKIYNFGTIRAMGQEMPGASAFIKEGDDIFHTYSTYTRGLDILNPTYHWLDMTAMGRDESALKSPMAWVRRHDEYGQ
ncbi:MAG: DUF899 domain-containing protein [Nannocystaceae bacterium]|nr:DUF899 domain-containing protein [Nannocystaceae bacterium]